MKFRACNTLTCWSSVLPKHDKCVLVMRSLCVCVCHTSMDCDAWIVWIAAYPRMDFVDWRWITHQQQVHFIFCYLCNFLQIVLIRLFIFHIINNSILTSNYRGQHLLYNELLRLKIWLLTYCDVCIYGIISSTVGSK